MLHRLFASGSDRSCLRVWRPGYEQLQQGAKSLTGQQGYRKFLRSHAKQFEIDEAKVRSDARFDGKWVLRTDMNELSAAEVALKYKQLWMVEEMFRTAKTLLDGASHLPQVR